MVAAAEAEAVRNNWAVAIAVIDSGGHLVMLQKLEQYATGLDPRVGNQSQDRARLQASDQDAGRRSRRRWCRYTSVGMGYTAAFEGGFPIIVDGKIIGAIGVAGVFSPQDAQVARAGLAAIGNPEPLNPAF